MRTVSAKVNIKSKLNPKLLYDLEESYLFKGWSSFESAEMLLSPSEISITIKKNPWS